LFPALRENREKIKAGEIKAKENRAVIKGPEEIRPRGIPGQQLFIENTKGSRAQRGSRRLCLMTDSVSIARMSGRSSDRQLSMSGCMRMVLFMTK
jgi:hypothetical protein